MSILQRPGWTNKQLVEEARGSGDPFRRKISSMFDKASLGNVPFYTISKVISALKREFPGKDIADISEEDIRNVMKTTAALSAPPAAVPGSPSMTWGTLSHGLPRKTRTVWSPEKAPEGYDPIEASIKKAENTRQEKQDNQNKESELFTKNFGMKFDRADIQKSYNNSYKSTVGIEIVSKIPFTSKDISAIRDVFDYSGDIEGEDSDKAAQGDLPPASIGKGDATGYAIEFDIPNDNLFISAIINQSRVIKITNEFRDDIEDAIGREVYVHVYPPTPSKEDDSELGTPDPVAHKESVKLSSTQVDKLLREKAIKRKQDMFNHEERNLWR